MQEWSNVIVTSLGLRLDAKVKTGAAFRITRVAVGDGFLDDGEEPITLTALKHEIPSHQTGTQSETATADITIARAVDTGTAAVKIRIENGDETFYLREIGIMAQDPDLGEILYAYTNSGDCARMMAAYDGTTHIVRKLTIPFLLSNTSNITANCTFISEVSEEVFNAYKTEVNARFGTVIPVSEKGSAGGVAELDSNGLVPSSQLPSYVDDVIECAGISAFPSTGESGKIYVDKVTNRQYRWSGTQYTEVSESLALGETAQTAYRGDRGKLAYDHSQAAHAPANAEPHRAPTTAEVLNALNDIKISINDFKPKLYSLINNLQRAIKYDAYTLTLNVDGICDVAFNNDRTSIYLDAINIEDCIRYMKMPEGEVTGTPIAVNFDSTSESLDLSCGYTPGVAEGKDVYVIAVFHIKTHTISLQASSVRSNTSMNHIQPNSSDPTWAVGIWKYTLHSMYTADGWIWDFPDAEVILTSTEHCGLIYQASFRDLDLLTGGAVNLEGDL